MAAAFRNAERLDRDIAALRADIQAERVDRQALRDAVNNNTKADDGILKSLTRAVFHPETGLAAILERVDALKAAYQIDSDYREALGAKVAALELMLADDRRQNLKAFESIKAAFESRPAPAAGLDAETAERIVHIVQAWWNLEEGHDMNAVKSRGMIRMMDSDPTPFDAAAVRYITTGSTEPAPEVEA
jgi:hypothetical protein